MDEYQPGQKVQYQLPDKKGKMHWLPGAIHGVRRYEDPATNAIIKITYLIDTGRNVRLDEHPFDHRDREINKRINKQHKPILDNPDKDWENKLKVVKDVLASPDLPDSKPDVDVVRQPEQIELTEDFIKPRK
jgi:hypothetical protein